MSNHTSAIKLISKRVFSKRIFILAVATSAFCVIPAATTRADVPLIAVPSASTSSPAAASTMPAAVLHMRITAYSSTPDQTDSTPFITANGTRVHDGVVATNLLPFGTKIEIPSLFGDKIFTVDDRTARRVKNTVDIWMSSTKQAIDFGVHYADIVVISRHGAVGSALAIQ